MITTPPAASADVPQGLFELESVGTPSSSSTAVCLLFVCVKTSILLTTSMPPGSGGQGVGVTSGFSMLLGEEESNHLYYVLLCCLCPTFMGSTR